MVREQNFQEWTLDIPGLLNSFLKTFYEVAASAKKDVIVKGNHLAYIGA